MTEIRSIDEGQGPTPKGQGPTGPNVVSSSSTKTPEGKTACSLNAYRHGLTGQIRILTPDEQKAYDQHSKITLEALAPVGDYERSLVQSIADDHWRLKRARTIEDSIFAVGMQHSADNTGSPQVDDAFAQGRTCLREAHSFQLLTIYEQRIQRAADKNTARLESLQARRKEAAQEAMRQAKLLYQLAQAEGRPYQPEGFFSTAPQVVESVFSTPEVARELSREILLADAQTHWVCSPKPTREAVATAAVSQASACDAPSEPTTHNPPPTAQVNPQPPANHPILKRGR
jgi:hypothetical protein